MKKKFLRRILLIPIGILVIFVGIIRFKGQIIHGINLVSIKILNEQNVIIETGPNIAKDDITINWFGSKSFRPLTFNSKNIGTKVPLSFGNNSFTVLYKDSIINTVGHLKIRTLKYHNYIFKFEEKSGKIDLDFRVEGPDGNTVKQWNSLYHWTKDYASASGKGNPKLNLVHSDNNINNKLEFYTSSINYQNLLVPNLEVKIEDLEGIINDSPTPIKSLKTRGRGTMAYRRKSFNIKLNDSVSFIGSEGKSKSLNSFYLISLSKDPFYTHNRIALDLLNELIGYSIFHTFAEVKINNETQGVYLVIENPKIYLKDQRTGDFILRRRYEGSSYLKNADIEDIGLDYDSDKSISKKELKTILNQYREIYKLLKIERGEKLYNSLNSLVDLEDYMKIMAFNYLMCNGDYSDELYFYKSGPNLKNRFNILPWDFDDIFTNAPHEGWELRNEEIPERTLIFSVENYLDLAVAKDPYLYDRYLLVMQDVLDQLQHYDIEGLFIKTYGELYPFYADVEIISPSKYDQFSEEYTLSGLEKHLQGTFSFLQNRISQTQSQLNEASNAVK